MSGLVLARAYYDECVAPLILQRWPGLPHAGARLGSGSDVLGLDDVMSRDHDWGLRLTLLVDHDHVQPMREYLEQTLPGTFYGWPTRFGTTFAAEVRHQVEIDSPDGFATSRLKISTAQKLSVMDWLFLTGQSVLEVTAGEVFADTDGRITQLRQQLSWYPDDVWRYVVAADWKKIAQELPFLGRTGFRGDEAGSRIITGRLAQMLMHLGFLLERRWPPYSKWLGTLFAQLPDASAALPSLEAGLAANSWQERQNHLCDAVTMIHQLQRTTALGYSEDLLEPFWDRPFRGIRDSAVRSILNAITDTDVRRLPAGVGSIEQWTDNVDVLGSDRRPALAAIWAASQ